MTRVSLQVKSLKGQVQDLQVDVEDTVREVKCAVSRLMHGQRVDEMKLIYRAKPMSDEDKSLASYGILSSVSPVTIHLVSRFQGGTNATLEIAAQLKNVLRARLSGLELIEPENDFSWNIMMRGPANSPYAKGLFSLTFTFPKDYPNSPPCIQFNTKIFHPNVYSSGLLCWHENDTSGSKYSAEVLIGAVNCLLEAPDTESPANSLAASLYSTDRHEFNLQAKTQTKMYAGFR